MSCINTSSTEFKNLLVETGMRSFDLEMSIMEWQQENNSDEFPAADSLEYRDQEVKYLMNVTKALREFIKPEDTKRTRKYGETPGPERLTLRLNTKERPNLEGNLIKRLQNKGVSNNQIDMVFDYMKTNNIKEMPVEDMIAVLLAENSFAVEINTATKEDTGFSTEDNQFEPDYDEEGNMIPPSTIDRPTSYYSNLTVPGGINYTENEIATPAITPNIKGHAQFATDQGIGWFRSDDRAIKDESPDYNTILKERLARRPNESEEDYSERMWDFEYTVGEYFGLQSDDPAAGFQYATEEQKIQYLKEIDEASKNSFYIKASKTRRILEVQSDLFQKGRGEKDLITNKGEIGDNLLLDKSEFEPVNFKDIPTKKSNKGFGTKQFGYSEVFEDDNYYYTEIEANEYGRIKKENFQYKFSKQNQFLQLLNKDGNWVKFFIQSIVKDSAKKGYEKVLFPTGETAAKVEGHQTIAEDIKRLDDEIKELKKVKPLKGRVTLEYVGEEGVETKVFNSAKEASKYQIQNSGWEIQGGETGLNLLADNSIKIERLEKEKQEMKTQGLEKLKPVEAFYTNRVTNILNKLYDVKRVTDEYGNTWNEIVLDVNKELDTPIFFQEPSLNTIAEIETELLKSPGIKRYQGGLMITKNGYVDAVNKVGRINRQIGSKAVTVHKSSKFGRGGREIFFIKINPSPSFFQRESKEETVPDEKLDKKLMSLMNDLGISLVNYDEYKTWYEKRYGKPLTANAVADILNRSIAVREGTRRKDTLGEEVSHFIVYAMKEDPRVLEALDNIESTKYWEQYSEQYMEAYNNDVEKVKLEIVGKMLNDSLLDQVADGSITPKWKTLLSRIFNAFMSFFRIGNKAKERRIREGLDALVAETLESPSIVKDRIDAMEDMKEDAQFFQIDPKMFKNSKMLDGMKKELEKAVDVLGTRINAYKQRGSSEFLQEEKALIRSLNRDLNALTQFEKKVSVERSEPGVYDVIYKGEKAAEIKLNDKNVVESMTVEPEYKSIEPSLLGAFFKIQKLSTAVSKPLTQLTADEKKAWESLVLGKRAKVFNDRYAIDTQDIRVTQGLIKFINHAENEADKVMNRLLYMRDAFSSGMYNDELAEFSTIVNDMSKFITIYKPIVTSVLQETRFDKRKLVNSGVSGDTLDRHNALIEALENISTGIEQMENDYKFYARNIFVHTMRPFLETYHRDKGLSKDEISNQVNLELEELLRMTEEVTPDIIHWNRLISSMAENPDELLRLTDRLVKDRILNAQTSTIRDMRELFDMDAKLKAAGVPNTEFIYERDAEGNLTGNLVSEYNEGEFEKAKEKFYKELHKRLNLPHEDSLERFKIRSNNPTLDQEYIEAENEWYEENSQLNPEYKKALQQKRKEFIENTLKFKKDIDLYYEIKNKYPEDFLDKLKKENKVVYNNTVRALKNYNRWKNERIWKDMDGNIRYRKEFAQPANKYKNRQYAEIMSSAPKKEYYEKYMNMRTSLMSHMNDRYRNKMLAPQIRKDILERLKSDPKNTAQETLNDILRIQQDDTAFGMLDEMGRPIKQVPIYYSSPLKNMNELSTDATASMVLFANMANRHRELSSIVGVIEIGADVMRERKVVDESLLAKAKKLGGINVESTEGGNVYDRYKSYIDMIFYGELKDNKNLILPDSVSEAKIIDGLIKYTSVNNLALNVFSGMSNVILGNALIREEAFAKQFVTQEDLSKARKAYWTDTNDGLAGLMGDTGKTRSDNKLRLFLEDFDVLQDFENRVGEANTDRNRFGRQMTESAFFLLNHMGEHQMQSRMALGMAFNKKVLLDGKKVDFYDVLEVENNRLKVRDGVKNLDGSDFTDADKNQFILKMQSVNQRLHGIYNINDRNAIQKSALGRAGMIFRKWMPTGIHRRFERKYRNYMIGDEVEGMYRTSGRFMLQLVKEIKEGQFTFASAGDAFDKLSPMEKANIKRSMVEVGYFLTAVIAGGMLAALAGDDDDNWALNMLAYQVNRFSTELGIFIPVWNIKEATKILKSPSAAVDQFENLLDITRTINPWWFYNDDPFFSEYKAGRNKGDLKLGVWAKRQIPMVDTIEDVFYPEERLRFFTNM